MLEFVSTGSSAKAAIWQILLAGRGQFSAGKRVMTSLPGTEGNLLQLQIGEPQAPSASLREDGRQHQNVVHARTTLK